MIDLNRKALDIPTKEIEVNVLGEKQKQEIRPVTGFARIKLYAKGLDDDLTARVAERVKAGIVFGAVGFDEEKAESLMKIDWLAALELFRNILEFTEEYDNSIAEERLKAEKNLNAEALTATQA